MFLLGETLPVLLLNTTRKQNPNRVMEWRSGGAEVAKSLA